MSEDLDTFARQHLSQGSTPIETIKAIRATGIPLGQAKAIVHRNLSPADQRAVEALWDAIEADLDAESN